MQEVNHRCHMLVIETRMKDGEAVCEQERLQRLQWRVRLHSLCTC